MVITKGLVSADLYPSRKHQVASTSNGFSSSCTFLFQSYALQHYQIIQIHLGAETQLSDIRCLIFDLGPDLKGLLCTDSKQCFCSFFLLFISLFKKVFNTGKLSEWLHHSQAHLILVCTLQLPFSPPCPSLHCKTQSKKTHETSRLAKPQ